MENSCLNCDENYDIYQCKGCSRTFCFHHLTDHRDKIQQNFAQLQDNCNHFKQNLRDFQNNSSLIQQINQWELESIDKIKQTANKCREKIHNYFIKIEKDLNDLSEQTKQISKENKLNEILLTELNKKLNKLREEVKKPSKISIQQHSTSFINQIYVNIQLSKEQYGIMIVAEGNNQFFAPNGICIDSNQTIYIVDYLNHRIIDWNLNSQQYRIVAGGNGRGKQMNQLNRPTDVIMDKETNSLIITDLGNRRVIQWSLENNTTDGQILIENIECVGLAIDKDGSLYVSDWEKNEVRRWKRGENKGTTVAGGNGKGDQLNQLYGPTFIFVDNNYSLYVSDTSNHRVIKWTKDAEEGMIIAGGNGCGNNLKQLSSPQGVVVDHLGQIYIADSWNHRVMCWHEGHDAGRIVVGENSEGNQLSSPQGLSFDTEGNLYVAEWGNHRIIKFEVD